MSEHRMVVGAQVQRALETSAGAAQARLRALRRDGYVRRERPFHGRACFHLITTRGLNAVGSRLRAPQLDLGSWEHDLGLGWVWLAAQAGAFGPLSGVMAERRMRSLDAAGEAADGERPPLAVPLGGVGPAGRKRLHYPDLLLITARGSRIAVELELTGKGKRRREQILMGYAGDGRIDGVLYLVAGRAVGRAVQDSARRLGAGRLVHVQAVHPGSPFAERGSVRGPERQGARQGAREAGR
jgi:hypothetical protein